MNKTAYYTDENFEDFMNHSELKLKNQFFVCLIASIICQPALWYILLTELAWGISFAILAGTSLVALFCLIGMGYCYYSARRSRIDYQEMRRAEREEMNALIDELEAARKILT